MNEPYKGMCTSDAMGERGHCWLRGPNGDMDIEEAAAELNEQQAEIARLNRYERECEAASAVLSEYVGFGVGCLGVASGMRELVAEIAELKTTCTWEWDDHHECYHTQCRNAFCFVEGGTAENNAVFCVYCGGKIVEDDE